MFLNKRFNIGTRVETLKDSKRDDWIPEARENCQWKVEGIVESVHDSHGLCYRVKHSDDGTTAAYDHDELKELVGQNISQAVNKGELK